MSGDRPEEPGPVEPILSVGEHVEDVHTLDPLRDQLLQRLEILRLLAFHQPPEDGLAVLDPEALIVRELRVHLGRDATQVFFHLGYEKTALHRKVNLLTIVGR